MSHCDALGKFGNVLKVVEALALYWRASDVKVVGLADRVYVCPLLDADLETTLHRLRSDVIQYAALGFRSEAAKVRDIVDLRVVIVVVVVVVVVVVSSFESRFHALVRVTVD